MTTNNDEIQEREKLWEATARAWIAMERSAILRDADENRPYGKLDTDTYDKGQVYRELRKALIEEEMKTAVDTEVSKDREAVRSKVDRLIYLRVARILLKEEHEKG